MAGIASDSGRLRVRRTLPGDATALFRQLIVSASQGDKVALAQAGIASPDLLVSLLPSWHRSLAAATGAKKIFVVSPNYIFGKSETNAFVATLKRTAPSAQIVNDQSTWYVPFPTNPRWDATINAIQAAKPDLVYSNIFAGDEINFITQALAVDPQFFTKYPMTTLVSVDELNSLQSKYPIGMHAYMRAPFFALQTGNSKLTDFITRYKAKYNEYPLGLGDRGLRRIQRVRDRGQRSQDLRSGQGPSPDRRQVVRR